MVNWLWRVFISFYSGELQFSINLWSFSIYPSKEFQNLSNPIQSKQKFQKVAIFLQNPIQWYWPRQFRFSLRKLSVEIRCTVLVSVAFLFLFSWSMCYNIWPVLYVILGFNVVLTENSFSICWFRCLCLLDMFKMSVNRVFFFPWILLDAAWYLLWT